MDHSGYAKLCDFGISRHTQATGNRDIPAYTTAYQAPEMFGSRLSHPSMASDVWALGCVILEVSPQLPSAALAYRVR